MDADIHPPGATTDAAPAAEALGPDVIPSAGEELIATLAVNPAEQPVILDFDETLWLRNSTEVFLDSVRPRLAAAIVLQILGVLKPWRLFQSDEPNHHRDWIRVLVVLIVCPWSLCRWRRKAVTLGPALLNRPLWEAVSRRSRSELGVVTFGFREIIRPLLQAIDPKLPLIESCSLRQGARLRRIGKAAALAGTRGETWLRRSLVVTDSKVDDDLLAASDTAFLVQWPDAEYEQAEMRPLLPFVYLQRVKRPAENYLRNAILGHDLPVLLLAFAAISTAPASTAIALLIFVFGFFAAYETGYHENDRLGLNLEEKPKISANYAKLAHHFSPSVAWGSAILISALAALIAAGESSWIPAKFGLAGGSAVAAVLGAFVLFMIGMRCCSVGRT